MRQREFKRPEYIQALLQELRETSDRKTIAARLKQAREVRGLGIARAAQIAGVALADWISWEDGSAELMATEFRHVCRALNVDSYWLVGVER